MHATTKPMAVVHELLEPTVAEAALEAKVTLMSLEHADSEAKPASVIEQRSKSTLVNVSLQ